MALDTGVVQNLLAYYAVVAALIVTASYTGVVTPPKEYSTCDDLCLSTVEKIVLGTRAALGICLPEGEGSQNLQACHVLANDEDFPAPKNRLQWLELQSIVKNYVKGVPVTSESPNFGAMYQIYMVFNGIALCSALYCIAFGVMFTFSAITAEDLGPPPNRTAKLNLTRVRLIMEGSLLVALICQFMAFMLALYGVFYIENGNNAGIITVWAIGGVLFLSLPLLWLWDTRPLLK